MDILLCFEIRSAVQESMKKPGVVPGFDDSRQAPDGANPRRGALPCGAVNCQKVN